MFGQFLQAESLVFYFPVSEAIMANFIAYLFDSQCAAATIASMTSSDAISKPFRNILN